MLPCNAPTAGARPGCILTAQFWCHFALVATLRLLYCFYDATTSFIFSADSLCFLFARQSLLAADFWKLVIFTSTSALCTVTNRSWLPWAVVRGNHVITSDFQCLVVPTLEPCVCTLYSKPNYAIPGGPIPVCQIRWMVHGNAGHALPMQLSVATFSFHCNYFTKILLRCCCCVLKLSNCLSRS